MLTFVTTRKQVHDFYAKFTSTVGDEPHVSILPQPGGGTGPHFVLTVPEATMLLDALRSLLEPDSTG